METNRMKKTLAILLAVLFLVTVTAGAASAMKVLVINAGSASSNDIGNGIKVIAASANTPIVSSSAPATPYFRQLTPNTAVSNDPAKFSTAVKKGFEVS